MTVCRDRVPVYRMKQEIDGFYEKGGHEEK